MTLEEELLALRRIARFHAEPQQEEQTYTSDWISFNTGLDSGRMSYKQFSQAAETVQKQAKAVKQYILSTQQGSPRWIDAHTHTRWGDEDQAPSFKPTTWPGYGRGPLTPKRVMPNKYGNALCPACGTEVKLKVILKPKPWGGQEELVEIEHHRNCYVHGTYRMHYCVCRRCNMGDLVTIEFEGKGHVIQDHDGEDGLDGCAGVTRPCRHHPESEYD